LGDALTLSARNYPEAIKVFNLALRDVREPGIERFGPRTGALYGKLARAYIKQGELDLSSQAVRTGAQYDLRNPVLAMADIYLQWRLGNREGAVGSLQAVSQMTGIQGNYAEYLDRFWANRQETDQMLGAILGQQK
jgi:hypothetical protein